MSKPVGVILGDIHFTIQTLELASAAVRQAKQRAHELGVPLIFNGDTLDSKAVIRAEVANRLIEILTEAPKVEVIINTGNHDRLHEKSKEHALNFLAPYAQIIDVPTYVPVLDSWVLPYDDDLEQLRQVLAAIPAGSRLIVHQGVKDAHMGHYIVDNTSLPPETFADFRVIASHYHRAQDIKTGRPRKGALGLFSYIGNPYSLTYSEAADGPKGFQVIKSDGKLEFVPTNLRKHLIIETDVDTLLEANEVGADPFDVGNPGDLVWLKVKGPSMRLAELKKETLGKWLFGHSNFKLDLIPTEEDAPKQAGEAPRSGEAILDGMIDGSAELPETKTYLKALWREVLA